jgi:hypothetical protein
MSTMTTIQAHIAYSEEDTVDNPASPPQTNAAADHTSGSGRSRASDSSRRSHADKSADEKPPADDDAPQVAVRSSERAASSAARLTLDDFGGRSDALGG